MRYRRRHRPKNKSRPTTRRSFRQASTPGRPEPGSPYDLLAQRKLAIVGHSAAASGTARRQTVRQHVFLVSRSTRRQDRQNIRLLRQRRVQRALGARQAILSNQTSQLDQSLLRRGVWWGGTTLTYRTFSASLPQQRVFDA